MATVVMPGQVKRSTLSLRIASAMEQALTESLGDSVKMTERRDLSTGYELFIVINIDEQHAKKIAMEIERTHSLGRLFDIDVINGNGVPVSRSDYGLMVRHCLICGNDARVCMRLRTHTVDELINHIQHLTDGYFRSI